MSIDDPDMDMSAQEREHDYPGPVGNVENHVNILEIELENAVANDARDVDVNTSSCVVDHGDFRDKHGIATYWVRSQMQPQAASNNTFSPPFFSVR